jgi:hypothetical protein
MLKNRNSEPKIESIEIEYKIGKNEKCCHQGSSTNPFCNGNIN